jgi:uncharacterized protein YeaO (DUF488 family)
MAVTLKRAYEVATPSDGTRVLVDRLWPRGIRKADFPLDEWLRDLAPSNELRKWFHSQPEHWAQFRRRYLKELSRAEVQADLRKLHALAQKRKQLTLLYASKDEAYNNAAVLKDLLEGARKPPASAGSGGIRGTRTREAATRRR